MDPTTEGLIDQLRFEIEELKGRVNYLEGVLNAKVDKNEIIAQINISPETIRISGDRISINQETMTDKLSKAPLRI